MASFAWGFAADSGVPILMDILSSGSDGVTVTWSTGASDNNAWQQWQEPQRPAAMQGVQDFSALAANAHRHVYAFKGGVCQEYVVSTDGLSWSRFGNVPTVRG